MSNRRKIMFASWSPPSEGVIQAKVEVNVEKVLDFIQSYPENERPLLQHIVCRAGSELLKEASDLNGKIVFGKFLKYQKINLGMLAQIGPTKEMVNLLVEDCEHKTIEDIRD